MKFETPKMNIEMFIAEDVITTSGEVVNSTVTTATNALGTTGGVNTNTNMFHFVFD